MNDLQCAVVGYGGIAEFHCDALRQIDGVRLQTLVGRRREPAESFARKHGFETVTTDYAEALDSSDVDAVVIASPSELHHEQTMAALAAGKHVLVEIPAAMSHRGARDIAGAARKADRKVLVAHTRRFDPVGLFARDFLASGKAGLVLQHQAYSFWHRHENVGWTGYRRSWTDDVLFHHGCHLVDFSLWTVGEQVRRVHGELGPKQALNNTSMDVSMLLRYRNDAIATISLSYNARHPAAGNRFICEEGVLDIDGKRVLFNGEALFETPENPESGVLVQNREFVDAVRQGREPSCNALDALRALEILQRVYDQTITHEGPDRYARRWGL